MRGLKFTARTAPPHSGWGMYPQSVRGVAVAICLLAMVLVPLAALDAPRPARLGWQMYSSVTPLPEIWVEQKDGSRENRLFGEIASGVRPELNYFEPMARFLCAREPDTAQVQFLLEDPRREIAIPCSQS